MYACRKSFATWLDETGAPAGVRESLLCHFDPYVKPNLRAQQESLSRLPKLMDFFGEKCVENGAGSGIDCAGGSRSEAQVHSVQLNNAATHPPEPLGTAKLSMFGGLPHCEGDLQPSTTPNPNENGHSRSEKAGLCAVFERVLGLLEAQSELMRRMVEACERQGAFDGDARDADGGGGV